MEDMKFKPGTKVAFLGARYVVSTKTTEEGVMIYPARRSMYGNNGLPDRAFVKPADLVLWEPKPKVSAHAKTCQICGRAIHAAVGVIAHHGYERPSDIPHYQTESCLGARFQAFEINRDRLEWYIAEVLKPFLQRLTDARAAIVHGVKVPGPSDVHKVVERKSGWSGRMEKADEFDERMIGPDYNRQKWGFKSHSDRTRVLKTETWELDRRGYDDYLAIAQAKADQMVEHVTRDLNAQQKRFDTWKPKKI